MSATGYRCSYIWQFGTARAARITLCIHAMQKLPAGIQMLKPPQNDLIPMVLSVINGNDYINYRCARTDYHLYFVYFGKRCAMYGHR